MYLECSRLCRWKTPNHVWSKILHWLKLNERIQYKVIRLIYCTTQQTYSDSYSSSTTSFSPYRSKHYPHLPDPRRVQQLGGAMLILHLALELILLLLFFSIQLSLVLRSFHPPSFHLHVHVGPTIRPTNYVSTPCSAELGVILIVYRDYQKD